MNDIPNMPEKSKSLRDRPSRARYGFVRQALETKWRRRELQPERVMRELVDVLWENFEAAPYSGCGFFLLSPDGRNLEPGPSRGEPAAEAKPLQGLFAEVLRGGKGVISSAADELAVPVFDQKGKAWAVLSVRSKDAAAFDDMDRRWLEQLMRVFSQSEE